MRPDLILAAILGLAVLGAWVRLALWRWAAPLERRGRPWRFVALMALQPICAVLLFFGLFPPDRPAPPSSVMVATAGAPGRKATDTSSRASRSRAVRPAPTTVIRRAPG